MVEQKERPIIIDHYFLSVFQGATLNVLFFLDRRLLIFSNRIIIRIIMLYEILLVTRDLKAAPHILREDEDTLLHTNVVLDLLHNRYLLCELSVFLETVRIPLKRDLNDRLQIFPLFLSHLCFARD